MDDLIDFLAGGWLDPSLGLLLGLFLAATFLTVLCVTVYLHRCQAHRGVDLHPLVTHPMRLWLWLSTSMRTRQWVAVHRKHHARCETAEDPHSPQIHGLRQVLFDGVGLYSRAAKDPDVLAKYGHGCPDDWIERHVYRHGWLGPTVLALVELGAFGAAGITFWALQMIWIPFFAAGVINGLGHAVGYRNFATEDTSTNLVAWGILLGGEELHNNHHAFPSSAKFALKGWEFDIGWVTIRALEALGLARVRRVAPKLVQTGDRGLDREALRAIFVHRFTVMSDYCRTVIRPAVADEYRRAAGAFELRRGQLRRLLSGNARFFSLGKRDRLSRALERSSVLATVYEHRLRLQALWDRSSTDPEKLLAALREWCQEAERSGIDTLRDFARSVASYRLAST